MSTCVCTTPLVPADPIHPRSWPELFDSIDPPGDSDFADHISIDCPRCTSTIVQIRQQIAQIRQTQFRSEYNARNEKGQFWDSVGAIDCEGEDEGEEDDSEEGEESEDDGSQDEAFEADCVPHARKSGEWELDAEDSGDDTLMSMKGAERELVLQDWDINEWHF